MQSALVYRTGPAGHEYLGKKEFDLPLRAEKTNSYIHQRERHLVQVDRIEPTTWKPNSGVLPTVYVSAATIGQEPKPKRRKGSPTDD